LGGQVRDKICSVAEAMADVHDGDVVAAHCWGACGTPGYLFRALAARGAKDLTFCCTNFLPAPPGLEDIGYPDPTVLLPQLEKIITPFLGTRAFRGVLGEDFLGDRVKSGQMEIEATTHGAFMERLHAGAMELGGFYSPVGLKTVVEKGKEKRVIDGKEYILEKPIRPDVGLVKALKADKLGNLVYRGSARASNPVIAMASRLTIVEVWEVVEVGELDPEMIVTPGIYVDRIVRIPDEDPAGAKRVEELFKNFARELVGFGTESGDSQGGQE